MFRTRSFALTGTSPAAAGTAVLATIRGLARYSAFRIDAVLTGATGDVLDVYLQRQVAAGVWVDWAHFAQQAAAAPAAAYALDAGPDAVNVAISTVGQTTDDPIVGALLLPAGSFVGGPPGDAVRLVAVAGALTTAGATQTVTITGEELFT